VIISVILNLAKKTYERNGKGSDTFW
jgi:hypothetical protein